MDRFDAMQAFARVVEAGSFTKAADSLNMSKSSVTQLVQQLEVRLRVKLLNRTTRQVNVTADGAAYYERVTRLLSDLEEVEAGLIDATTKPMGKLRVDVPGPLGRILLVPALPAFLERYPDIQIDVGVSDRMVDLIGENVDCVLRGGELMEQSLIARRVGDLRYGVCAAPRYLQRAGTPSHPSEVIDGRHRIVGFNSARTGKPLPFALYRDGERIELRARCIVSVDDGGAYLAAALSGLGIARLPHFMSEHHVARGELVPLFEGWRSDSQPLYLAYPQNRRVGAKLRVFLDWVSELMSVHAPMVRERER